LATDVSHHAAGVDGEFGRGGGGADDVQRLPGGDGAAAEFGELVFSPRVELGGQLILLVLGQRGLERLVRRPELGQLLLCLLVVAVDFYVALLGSGEGG